MKMSICQPIAPRIGIYTNSPPRFLFIFHTPKSFRPTACYFCFQIIFFVLTFVSECDTIEKNVRSLYNAMSHNFTPIKELMHELTECRGIPGADIIVSVDNTPVYRYFTGYSDREAGRKIDENTRYFLFSASKPMTCASALRLVERGLLDLNAPLYEYLPEFAHVLVDDGKNPPHEAKNPITIRDLFCMTNGYSYEYSFGEHRISEMQGQPCPTVPTVKQLAKLPLRFEPHTNFAYGLGHDMLAAVCETVVGKKFRDYMKEVIFDPLGMSNSHMHVTEEDRSGKLAALYEQASDGTTTRHASQDNEHIFGPEYDSGGAGVISCPSDYIRFAMTMTARGTSPDGYELLRPETVELMRKPQLSAAELAGFAACNLPGYSYGLGVRTHIDPSASRRLSPVGEFGWDGAVGAFVSFDPENKISIVYMQSVYGTPHPINHKDILNTVYGCLGF